MKRSKLPHLLPAVLSAALLFAFSVSAQPFGKFVRAKNPVPNSYIVVLEDSTDLFTDLLPAAMREENVKRISADLASSHGGRIDLVYAAALKGFSVKMSAAEAESLSRDPRVKYVEEDFYMYGTQTTQLNPTWGLGRIDQRRETPTNNAYVYDTTGTGVHAYVIDSGIRNTHAEFGTRVSFGADFVNDGRNGGDCHGHGTHVAGTLGGTTYGVAKNVSLHNVRVLGCDNRGTGSAILGGINWVANNRVLPAVVNFSIGMDGISTTVENAIAASIANGASYSIAAGNLNVDACTQSPGGRVPTAVSVGATDISEQRAPYSNWGPCVDISAPGSGITSASHLSDTGTAVFNGTSMAAPHVAGVMARLLEVNSLATPAQIKSVIVNGATNDVLSTLPPNQANRLLYSRVSFITPTIITPEEGTGNPYPAEFVVSGLTQPIANVAGSVQVRIEGLHAPYAGDLYLVLVGPSGAAMLVKSGSSGNSFVVEKSSFTISDTGATALPGGGFDIPDGVYRPNHFGGLDFPIPGPAGSEPLWYNHYNTSEGTDYPMTLTRTFAGTDPNGTWKLFAYDPGNNFYPLGSSIDSWSVSITYPQEPPPEPTPTPTPPPYNASAAYLREDRLSQGNWKQRYGLQGSWTLGDVKQMPSWAEVTASGQYYLTWSYSTADPRALQRKFLEGATDRRAAALYSSGQGAAGSEFQLSFDLTDGQERQLGLYCLDWDNSNRSQTFEIVDATTGAILDTRTVSDFDGGVYLFWRVKGRFNIRVKNDGGLSPNSVISGIFIDAAPPPPVDTSARFIEFDAVTKGNWVNKYGYEAYLPFGQSFNTPSWVQVTTPNGSPYYNWSNSTMDERALQLSYVDDRRIVGLGTSTYSETPVHLTDGQLHKIAIYFVDWERRNRQQTIEIVNPDTGLVLDSRSLANFGEGIYGIWEVKGRFLIRITNNAGPNNDAVYSGVFVDPLIAPPPPTPTPTPTAVYNPVTEFAPDSNPDGPWKYGYAQWNLPDLSLFEHSGEIASGVRSWSPNPGGVCCGMISRNISGTTQTYNGTIEHLPEFLFIQSGPTGQKTSLRWTAPRAGSYEFRGRFQGIDTARTAISVHISRNTGGVWSGYIPNFGNYAAYRFVLNLNQGDFVDYGVGFQFATTTNGAGLTGTISTWDPQPTPTPTATPTPTPSPTPAPLISISGRVYDKFDRGLRAGVVSLTDPNGNVRHAVVNSFGHFRFQNVQSGVTYTLTVQGKGRSVFQPLVLQPQSNVEGMIITADP